MGKQDTISREYLWFDFTEKGGWMEGVVNDLILCTEMDHLGAGIHGVYRTNNYIFHDQLVPYGNQAGQLLSQK